MSRTSERGSAPARVSSTYLSGPRTLFVVSVIALVCFGFLMIYSASSIKAMYDGSSGTEGASSLVKSTHYLRNQMVFAGIGLLIAAFLAHTDYHIWSRSLLVPMGVATLAVLLLVYVPGLNGNAKGADRWILIGSHQLQPSEFAKVSIVLIAAQLGEELGERDPDNDWYGKLFLFVALPLGLILMEPDKGAMAILGLTLLVMLWYCGVRTTWILGLLVVAAVGVLSLALVDGYARKRIEAMLDPNADPSDAGYQINQGYLAFGTGGLFGVGLGTSHQKYGYLPEEHTDYIYAVIGEELGLCGTLLVLILFGLLVYAGYQIARRASDTDGRLIAAGFSTLIGIQLFVNVCGVLGIVPASGKPIPFISYGGSSIISCLMMAGFIVSVSLHSELPATVYEERRSRLQLYGEPDVDAGLRVLAGGARSGAGSGRAGTSPSDLRAARDAVESLGGSITYNANGSQRINLGSSARERLRGR